MGTCCAACLVPLVRAYAPNAENGAVTVTIVENPITVITLSGEASLTWPKCSHCPAPAEFIVSYYPKKTPSDDPTQPDSSLRREIKERK